MQASKLPYHKVKELLMSQDNTLHRPVAIGYSRRKTLLFGQDELWQADLVDLI